MNNDDLEYDIALAIDKWDERSNFTIAGVKGLTRADLDTLILCCEYFDERGTLYPLRHFSEPVKLVMRNYGML